MLMPLVYRGGELRLKKTDRTKAATQSEYTTNAALIEVAEAPKSAMMPPMDTGMAVTLNDSWICARRISAIGRRDSV